MRREIKSFVTINEDLAIITSREELVRLLSTKKDDKVLHNIDISSVDIDNLDLSGFYLSNVIIGTFDPSSTNKRRVHHVDFTGCKMRKVIMSQCDISQCIFDKTTCDVLDASECGNIDFFFSTFSYSRFKHSKLTLADFRYSKINDCSLGNCHFYLCDFYMAGFNGATNFQGSCFESCSLTFATFENEILKMENITSLNQENFEEYQKLNNPALLKFNPTGGMSYINHSHERIINAERTGKEPDIIDILESRQFIAKEASDIYIYLSGIYSGKGLNRDSNLAYRKANLQKKIYMWTLMQASFRKGEYWTSIKSFFKWLTLIFVGTLGYGYRMMPVFLWLIFIIGIFTWYYFLVSNGDTELGDGIAYSIVNSLSPYDKYLQNTKDLFASIETMLGVIIMGFIGFIFANKIRNNS